MKCPHGTPVFYPSEQQGANEQVGNKENLNYIQNYKIYKKQIVCAFHFPFHWTDSQGLNSNFLKLNKRSLQLHILNLGLLMIYAC